MKNQHPLNSKQRLLFNRPHNHLQRRGQCQPITIPMCQNVDYNLTSTPNSFLHSNQHEAALEAHQFWPLLQLSCSTELRFFLCASYAPVCVPQLGGRTLPVCRQVCERVRSSCEPLMLRHSFAWPERLRCHRLPLYGGSGNGRDQPMCVDNRNGESDNSAGQHVNVTAAAEDHQPWACSCQHSACTPTASPPPSVSTKVNANISGPCSVQCYSPFFSGVRRERATMWVFSAALVGGAGCLFTLGTFLLDRTRYPYPERPLVFMAANQLLICVGYTVRAWAGHAGVLCHRHIAPPTVNVNSAMCTATAALVAYGSSAAQAWWLILAGCWLTAGALQWAGEVIESHWRWMHMLALVWPAAVTTLVLNNRHMIGADTLIGMCRLGSSFSAGDTHGDSVGKLWSAPQSLLVLMPPTVSVLLGAAMMSVTFVATCRVRRSMDTSLTTISPGCTGVRNSQRLKALMRKLVLLTVLYSLNGGLHIMCSTAEQLRLLCKCGDQWQLQLVYAAAVARHITQLAGGAISAVWIVSGKSVTLWLNVLSCRWCGHKSVGQLQPTTTHHHRNYHHHHRQPITSTDLATAAATEAVVNGATSDSWPCHSTAKQSLSSQNSWKPAQSARNSTTSRAAFVRIDGNSDDTRSGDRSAHTCCDSTAAMYIAPVRL